MPTRKAKALWEGTLKEGKGRYEAESWTVQGAYTFASRFGEGGAASRCSRSIVLQHGTERSARQKRNTVHERLD